MAGAVSGVFLFSLAVERGVNGAYGEILCCFTPAREEFYRIRINTHYTHTYRPSAVILEFAFRGSGANALELV